MSSGDTEVARIATALIQRGGRPRTGEAILTRRRLEFHEPGEAAVAVELDDVLAISHERRWLNRDRIRIRTTSGEFLFNDGWKAWSPILRERIEARGARRVDGAPPAPPA